MTNHATTLVEYAQAFATDAHAKQTRKYTGDPYIIHPAAVAALVASVPHTPQMLAAAWLHDVVEDCGVTFEIINREFGPSVYEMVYWLTDVSRPSDGNRAIRKAKDRAHLAKAPGAAQTIKYADLIDNLGGIALHDPDFAIVYRKEKAALLAVMDKGDHTLRLRAMEVVA